MDVTLGGPTDFDQKHTLVRHNVKVECQKCGFRYSDDKASTLHGEIIDHNDKTLLVRVIEWPRGEPDRNVSKKEQFESRNVSYPHNNFHSDALDTLRSMGEMLEFLIVNNMIVRILTGWE